MGDDVGNVVEGFEGRALSLLRDRLDSLFKVHRLGI